MEFMLTKQLLLSMWWLKTVYNLTPKRFSLTQKLKGNNLETLPITLKNSSGPCKLCNILI